MVFPSLLDSLNLLRDFAILSLQYLLGQSKNKHARKLNKYATDKINKRILSICGEDH